jgi:hypothetical protein
MLWLEGSLPKVDPCLIGLRITFWICKKQVQEIEHWRAQLRQ